MNEHDKVMCETHGTTPHALTDTCRYPHFVAPAGPEPQVGHPLHVTD